MRSSRACPLALVLVATFAASSALAAQSAQAWSVQASGLYAKLFGTAFEGLRSGAGFEAQLRYTRSAWSYGAGVQYTRHSLDDPSLSGASVNLLGLFFEPRYTIPVSNNVGVYLSGRFAYSRVTFDFQGVSGSGSGGTVNGGGGVLLSLSPRVNLDIGATYGYTKFGNVSATFQGQTITAPLGSGSNVIGRLGLAIGLGG